MLKLFFIILIFPFYCCAQSIDNLDIKNGFLQFHLGDSINTYASIIKADKHMPGHYAVADKAIKLRHHLQNVSLYFENGILESIDIYIMKDFDVDYMNKALVNAYGDGSEIKNGTEMENGYHISYQVWTGKRVVLLIKKGTLSLNINGKEITGAFENITFKKTSDDKIEGTLDPKFLL